MEEPFPLGLTSIMLVGISFWVDMAWIPLFTHSVNLLSLWNGDLWKHFSSLGISGHMPRFLILIYHLSTHYAAISQTNATWQVRKEVANSISQQWDPGIQFLLAFTQGLISPFTVIQLNGCWSKIKTGQACRDVGVYLFCLPKAHVDLPMAPTPWPRQHHSAVP